MSTHPLQQRSVHVAGIGLHRYQRRSDASFAELGVAAVRQALDDAGISFKDLHTTESSLEDIFVSLVKEEG